MSIFGLSWFELRAGVEVISTREVTVPSVFGPVESANEPHTVVPEHGVGFGLPVVGKSMASICADVLTDCALAPEYVRAMQVTAIPAARALRAKPVLVK
jgi:hypothetical protein